MEFDEYPLREREYVCELLRRELASERQRADNTREPSGFITADAQASISVLAAAIAKLENRPSSTRGAL